LVGFRELFDEEDIPYNYWQQKYDTGEIVRNSHAASMRNFGA
jgi:hypothetical protein